MSHNQHLSKWSTQNHARNTKADIRPGKGDCPIPSNCPDFACDSCKVQLQVRDEKALVQTQVFMAAWRIVSKETWNPENRWCPFGFPLRPSQKALPKQIHTYMYLCIHIYHIDSKQNRKGHRWRSWVGRFSLNPNPCANPFINFNHCLTTFWLPYNGPVSGHRFLRNWLALKPGVF